MAIAPFSAVLPAQVSLADYERALDLQEKYCSLVLHLPDQVEWIEGTDRFGYSRSIPGGHEFVLVDAEKQTQQPAFDHARLAAELTKELGEPVKPEALPLERLHLDAGGAALEFARERERWRRDLTAYTCSKRSGRNEFDDEDDGGYNSTPRPVNGPAHAILSPDGNWLAFVENYNVALRLAHANPKEAEKRTVLLSEDGSDGNYYALETLAWSRTRNILLLIASAPATGERFITSSPHPSINSNPSIRPWFIRRPAMYWRSISRRSLMWRPSESWRSIMRCFRTLMR